MSRKANILQNNRLKIPLLLSVLFYLLFFIFSQGSCAYAQEKKEGITINGDVFEYSTVNDKQVSVTGNVEVFYKGAKLTCDKLSVNTETKDAQAEGNVRLEDERGVVEGSKVIYNLEKKAGIILDAQFRVSPYFGKCDKLERVSEKEFIARGGYVTTCNLDKPHYRFKARQVKLFPQDKIQTRGDTFYIGETPLLYLPRYNHSLKDPMMHVRFMPGKSKDWGPYALTAWRYNIGNGLDGRVYFDYRERLGFAEGLGLNYNAEHFGKGDLKYYYTQERPKSIDEGVPDEFQRYLVRLRHKWDIDNNTSFTSEVYRISDERRKISDSSRNFLKDYFYREYEKDSQPLSYALLHHNFSRSSLDLLLQKRINHWFDHIERLPEIEFTQPSLELKNTPFYFENNSSFASLNKKASTSPATSDEQSVTRFDTTNKISLPVKLSIFRLSPYVSSRQTIYDKELDGSSLPIRNIFYSGVEASTKFYRIFDVKSGLFGMDINGLRHVITPTIGYAYNHEPTISTSKLHQIDSIDSIDRSNCATLELSNKLQTKRDGASVDFVDLRLNSSYVFKPKTGDKLGSNLSDILFEARLIPYSWLRIEGDSTYKHSGDRSDVNYRKISLFNYDVNFSWQSERSFGFGQRYQRKGTNELTFSFQWRFNPKWKFTTYHRYNCKESTSLIKGLTEQEYTISRDLHCWEVDFTFNSKLKQGSSLWIIFRVKAFPETEFGISQSYNQPKSGSQ